jgi:hypothetical protein
MDNFHIYSKNQAIYLDIIQHDETALDKTITEALDLELIHLILKHARSCESCPVQLRYTHLFQIVVSQAAKYLKTPKELPYPLLICMIDLLKNDVSLLTTTTLRQFLTIACAGWHHEKIYVCRKSMELCIRIIPIVSNYDIALDAILAYIQLCRQHIRQQDILRFQSIEYTEFFHHTQFAFDRVTCKLLIELILCTCLKQDLNANYITTIQKELSGTSNVFVICY